MNISFTLFRYSIFQKTFGIRLLIQKIESFSRPKCLGNTEVNYEIVDYRKMRKWRWLFVDGREGKTDGLLQQKRIFELETRWNKVLGEMTLKNTDVY